MKGTYADLIEAAFAEGKEVGEAAGSWIADGNSSEAHCRAVIKGYEDGDPVVLDMQPAPLSGEWADSPTPRSVLRDLGDGENFDAEYQPELADEMLTAYEQGFSEGFWDEAIRTCRGFLPDEGNEKIGA